MSKIYTEQELADLISKVESEFSAHLAKAEDELKAQSLAKSEELASDKMAKSEEKDEKEEKEEAKEDAKEEAKEEPKEEEKEEESKEDADHDYDEEDLEELHKLYKGMSESERQLHHSAIKKCMAKVEDAPMAKSEEVRTETTIVSEELSLAKTEIEALKSANEELKKSLEAIVQTLNKKFVKPAVVPQRKAITELTVLNKSEQAAPELSRKEIVKKLEKVAATPDLKKSDREAINAYCVGSGTLDSIQHLLKNN